MKQENNYPTQWYNNSIRKKTKYSQKAVGLVKKLRSNGYMYSQINKKLKTKIPKSTMSTWCKNIPLPKTYQVNLNSFIQENIKKARVKALTANKKKRKQYLKNLEVDNSKTSKTITNKKTAKIALAMLCLGEASKYSRGRNAFYLGSADKRLVLLFINLLEYCFDDFQLSRIRCRIQCRADQDTKKLEKYWTKAVKISTKQFYKPLIDPRTVGKKTKKKDYMGVLRVNYYNTHTQLTLETIANQVYKITNGLVVQR